MLVRATHVWWHVLRDGLSNGSTSPTTDIIEVDLVYPENNREVHVLTIDNVLYQSSRYHCFDIALTIDVRDAVVAGGCSAVLVSETEVLLSYPTLGFALSTDSRLRNARLKLLHTHDPQVESAQNMWINELKKAPQRMMKRLLLRFPDHVLLANVLNPQSFVIKHVLVVDYAQSSLFKNVSLASAQLQWRVADMNTEREETIAVDAPTDLEETQALFARMLSHGA
jgi:hypothetical protein